MKHRLDRPVPREMTIAVALLLATVSASPETGPTPLERRLRVVRLNDAALSDALQVIAKAGHVTIAVDWPELRTLGIEPTDPVTAKLRYMRVDKAIALLLKNVEGDDDDHHAYVIPGAGGRSVTITSLRVLRSTRTIVDYRVGDLVDAMPDIAPDQAMDELVEYVAQDVDPNGWVQYGGSLGVVVIDQGARLLHVLQSAENHRRVSLVLRDLRESRDVTPVKQTWEITILPLLSPPPNLPTTAPAADRP